MFTRSTVSYHPGFGYILLACVASAYQPGKQALQPALFVSSEGTVGTWQYLGKLSGEPVLFANEHYVWSDCGSIFCMADGSWRIYLNGYSVTLGLLMSETITGPWRFLRSDTEPIKELATALVQTRKKDQPGYAFPTVVRVNENEWHAWFSQVGQASTSGIYGLRMV